jgi:hypothetical protein
MGIVKKSAEKPGRSGVENNFNFLSCARLSVRLRLTDEINND